ncbi:hypothetical protein [uncultured Muriicola sp.]|uniref:TapB family protein n=1 Tax=uncultured Muriicola sp. TaxID=1583102 RepID=UPI00261C43F8|nr:hypothetical protein [uncultured Muriicola sp.]
MKKIMVSFSLIVFFFGGVFGQNCSQYYPMEEGATFQYTNYNKKGKTEGIADYKVTEVVNNGGTTQATMSIALTDEKGKEIYNTSYSFSCTDNKVSIDYESLLPESMIDQMGDMEMEITGTDIELPNNLEVGQVLPDANVTMTMSVAGMNMKTVVNILNRKVEKKETITTSAGSFDCFVIYSDSQTQAMGMNRTFPSRLWLAEGVGMVKQETYQKKGDVMSSTELTAFTK